MLENLDDMLAIPTLVLRKKVGNISPVHNIESHMPATVKNRPINAKATPAF